MLLTLLSQIATFGLLAMLVMAANAIAFAWLGGRLGVVLGQLYLMLFVFNMDLNKLPIPVNNQFIEAFIFHVIMINILLLPAWILGLLLRQMNAQKKAQSQSIQG